MRSFLLCLTAASTVWAQGAPERTFEVAVIRPMATPNRADLQPPACTGDRFVMRGLRVLDVMMFAFETKKVFDIVGDPAWVRGTNDYWAIEAKAEGGAIALAECRRMVAALLRDRFKLKHREEMRESDAFDLVVGPKGHKMRVAAPDAPPVRVNGSPLGVPAGAPKDSKAPGGLPMSALASLVGMASAVEQRPVVDKTGLQGNFTFDFEFSMFPNDNRPDVFQAVQDQLGLKLERSKTRVKTIVVESIERPSEN